MPADNFIVSHWKAEMKVFDQNLLLLREKLTPEAIHDLRVATKKLRSYLKLHSILFNEKSFDEGFQKTSELFSVLGKHRNIQIVKELLPTLTSKNKGLPGSLLIYVELLQQQVAPYCEQIIEQYDRTELDQLTSKVEKDTQPLITEDAVRKIKEIILSSFEHIQDTLKHFQKKSHLVRKRFKDIYYWLKILPDESTAKPETKAIDKILNQLGAIQDHEVLVNNLKSFRRLILTKTQTDFGLVKETEEKAKKKKVGLLEKAHALTKDLVSKVNGGKTGSLSGGGE